MKKNFNKRKRTICTTSTTIEGRREEFEKEKLRRYSSLFAVCSKIMRREAKVVKSFECQKIVRKLKAVRESRTSSITKEEDCCLSKSKANSNNELSSSSSTEEQRIQKLDEKLKGIKALDLDDFVTICFDRTGMKSVNPVSDDENPNNVETNKKKDKKKEEECVKVKTNERQSNQDDKGGINSTTTSSSTSSILQNMFQHKRIKSALESIIDKITEFRNWMKHRGAWVETGQWNHHHSKRTNISPKDNQTNTIMIGKTHNKKRKLDFLGGHHDDVQGGTSFITSLAGLEQSDEYGHDDQPPQPGMGDNSNNMMNMITKKKNRAGQRSRKAKAMAIEAKKAGKEWHGSINWRPKKTTRRDEQSNVTTATTNYEAKSSVITAMGLKHDSDINASNIASMGKNWKDDGKAHPSWAAREAQKAKQGIGIVKFSGKKITF